MFKSKSSYGQTRNQSSVQEVQTSPIPDHEKVMTQSQENMTYAAVASSPARSNPTPAISNTLNAPPLPAEEDDAPSLPVDDNDAPLHL